MLPLLTLRPMKKPTAKAEKTNVTRTIISPAFFIRAHLLALTMGIKADIIYQHYTRKYINGQVRDVDIEGFYENFKTFKVETKRSDKSFPIHSQDYNKVLCYEIDTDMIEVLNDTILESNLVIIEGDFLKRNVEKDIKQHFDSEKVCLIANLPYYITSPILLKLLEEVPSVKDIVIMIQKEVAERFVAKPNTKDYNALSVLIQYFTKAEKLFDVSPNAFVPAPNVTSSVIHLSYKDSFSLSGDNLAFFLKFNRNIFKQRRKTLVNNICSSFNISKEEASKILVDNGFKDSIRAEVLSVDEIVKLSEIFKDKIS